MDKPKMDSDISRAKAYLKIVYPVAHVPDKLCEILKLSCTPATLSRKCRAASVGPNPELIRSYYRNKRSEDIAIYASSQNYKPPGTPVKAPKTAPTLYFYTRALRGSPSPFYLNLQSLKSDIRSAKLANPALDGFYIYCGSYEAPVLLEGMNETNN